MTSVRDRILNLPLPHRICRPDQCIRTFIMLQETDRQPVRIVRHWSQERGCTEPCHCDPACGTAREDVFWPALLLVQTDDAGVRSWEPVVLHLTTTTEREILTKLRLGSDSGSLAGVMVKIRRLQGGRGRSAVLEVVRVSRPPAADVDVPSTLRRRRVDVADVMIESTSAIIPEDEQVVTPARARSDKPRVPLGKKP